MPSRSRLLLLGGLTLLAALIIFFPARIAYQWFAPPALKLASIDGSIWRGTAGEASVAGLYLRDLRWRMRPLALFSGKLAYALEASPGSGFVAGNVAIGLRGAISATDMTASLPLQMLQQAFRVPGLSGSLSLQVDELKLENCVPVVAQGSFEVADLVHPTWYRYSLGGYRGVARSDDIGVVVRIEDTDGIIDVEGDVQITRDGELLFEPLLAPKPETPPEFRRIIESFPLAEDGVRRIPPLPLVDQLRGC